jgi:hypothetical protein
VSGRNALSCADVSIPTLLGVTSLHLAPPFSVAASSLVTLRRYRRTNS